MTERCLQAVVHCVVPAEFLLVDNSSRGLIAPVDERVNVVRAAWPGLSRARDTGCIHARGDLIVFVDDDVMFDGGWLNRMIEPLRADRADVVASPVDLTPAIRELQLPRLFREWLAENEPDDERVRLVGAGMAFRRSLLGKALWDPDLGSGPSSTGYGEETLFELMCRDAGARVVYAEGPAAVHDPDRSRISPQAFLEEAAKKGTSDAFVDHHWHGASLKLSTLRTVVRALRATRHRRLMDSATTSHLVTAAQTTEAAAYAAAMRRLRRTPRRYSH